MRKIIWIAHISLDGYVANKAGALDGFESGEDNLDFVAEICKEADTILSGRVTHELLHSFWPEAGDQPGATYAEKKYAGWYNAANKIIATRSPSQPCEGNLSFVDDNLSQYVRKVKSCKGSEIVIFGSPDIGNQLMEGNLIDVYWVFVNPVLFGEGIPLFKSGFCQRRLTLIETRRFANGEIALKYLAEK
ncbi:dihydrofolate reductase family protein [Niabella hibiscisoli]|uniref:dihydrofolate reductase family protein n=1 Tax=Niabella hibiscisoli TaxID=1825928 RepID=UPI001F0CF747|nr:dihydrofolate reductase family protein [Niabella hibiscisoli]MCH5715220.1 dihydrofolate reductase family protein [Niabella hibiscisoli]